MENDPYRASWRFLRYDDHEIFEADDAWFDRQAREVAEAGFTHVMTFSNTHFRWSFRRDFGHLTDVLRRLVAACHRYGLRVVEHHSACLMWAVETDAQKKRALERNNLQRWPHLLEDADPESLWDGVKIKDMLQVSGETGRYFVSFMNSYIMCHNNPHYLKSYLDYLDTLYATGIDGIMTDDIQFCSATHPVGDDHVTRFDMDSCTCPACRAKFKAQTGLELPPPGEAWRRFMADPTGETFLKWKAFRYQSSLDFHRLVAERYTRAGLRMLRPNYTATSVAWVSPWAFVFDDLPKLDWAFVEHCCGIIRYSYPEYLFESIHCNMQSRQRKIPTMSLYYPSHADQQLLSWGLSLYAGHRYLGDPRKAELFADQKRFHDFENRYFDELFKIRENARLAFFDSQWGRELDPDYNGQPRRRFNSMAQSCILHNIPWAMVNPSHGGEYASYEVIVVPGAAFMRDEEIRDLGRFAANGGTLVWCDNAGTRDTAGFGKRSAERIRELLGSQGKILFLTPTELPGSYYRRCRADGVGNRDAFNCSEPERWRPFDEAEKAQSRAIAAYLAALLPGGSDLRLAAEQEGLLISSYYQPESQIVTVRLVNTAGTHELPELPGFGESDPIPFPELTGTLGIQVRKPDALKSKCFRTATLARLDAPEESLPVTDDGENLSIEVEAAQLRDFILLLLK